MPVILETFAPQLKTGLLKSEVLRLQWLQEDEPRGRWGWYYCRHFRKWPCCSPGPDTRDWLRQRGHRDTSARPRTVDYSPGLNPVLQLLLFYWILATSIHLLIIYGWLHATIAELDSCDRDPKICKVWSFYFLTLYYLSNLRFTHWFSQTYKSLIFQSKFSLVWDQVRWASLVAQQ